MITPLLVLIWCCTVSKQQIWSIKFACYANFGRLLVHGCYFDGQTIIYSYLLAGILRLSHGKPTLYSSIVFYSKRFCRRGHKYALCVQLWKYIFLDLRIFINLIKVHTVFIPCDGHWHAILQQKTYFSIPPTLLISKRAF